MHDLLLKGGTVIDPSMGLDGPCDIAVRDGVIARIGRAVYQEAVHTPAFSN